MRNTTLFIAKLTALVLKTAVGAVAVIAASALLCLILV